jgi:hypothetical protein
MEFKLISDVSQKLNPKLFGEGWAILGVAGIPGSNLGRARYFFLLQQMSTGDSYIEEYVDFPEYFIKIEDDSLWSDLYMYFTDKGLISFGIGKEKKIAQRSKS